MTNITEMNRYASEMRKQSGFKDIHANNIVLVRDDLMKVYIYSRGDVLVSAFGCVNNRMIKVTVTCY